MSPTPAIVIRCRSTAILVVREVLPYDDPQQRAEDLHRLIWFVADGDVPILRLSLPVDVLLEEELTAAGLDQALSGRPDSVGAHIREAHRLEFRELPWALGVIDGANEHSVAERIGHCGLKACVIEDQHGSTVPVGVLLPHSGPRPASRSGREVGVPGCPVHREASHLRSLSQGRVEVLPQLEDVDL
jgi:hypothetical protein